MGLSMFNLTSPLKENSVLFMFREFERIRKKNQKGPFSYDLVSKARKSIKSYLRELFQSWLAGAFLSHNSTIRTEKVITYRRINDSSNTLTTMKKTRSLDDIFIFRESEKGLKRTP